MLLRDVLPILPWIIYKKPIYGAILCLFIAELETPPLFILHIHGCQQIQRLYEKKVV